MTQPLAQHGIPTIAVALPSCGEAGDTLGDLADDVQACRHAIADVDGPVVLYGHSYGAMVITEAGADHPGDAVAAPADSDRQVVAGGEPDRGDHIGGAGAAHNRAGRRPSCAPFPSGSGMSSDGT